MFVTGGYILSIFILFVDDLKQQISFFYCSSFFGEVKKIISFQFVCFYLVRTLTSTCSHLLVHWCRWLYLSYNLIINMFLMLLLMLICSLILVGYCYLFNNSYDKAQTSRHPSRQKRAIKRTITAVTPVIAGSYHHVSSCFKLQACKFS